MGANLKVLGNLGFSDRRRIECHETAIVGVCLHQAAIEQHAAKIRWTIQRSLRQLMFDVDQRQIRPSYMFCSNQMTFISMQYNTTHYNTNKHL